MWCMCRLQGYVESALKFTALLPCLLSQKCDVDLRVREQTFLVSTTTLWLDVRACMRAFVRVCGPVSDLHVMRPHATMTVAACWVVCVCGPVSDLRVWADGALWCCQVLQCCQWVLAHAGVHPPQQCAWPTCHQGSWRSVCLSVCLSLVWYIHHRVWLNSVKNWRISMIFGTHSLEEIYFCLSLVWYIRHYVWINLVQNLRISVIFGTHNLEGISLRWFWTCPPHLNVTTLPWKMQIWCVLSK